MRPPPGHLQLLAAAAAAVLALWSYALVTGAGRAQGSPVAGPGAAGGVAAGGGGTPRAAGGRPASPRSPKGSTSQPGPGSTLAGAAPAGSPEPETPAQAGPPATGGGDPGSEPQEPDGSIPALKRPGDPAPEPGPIAPVYRPDEMAPLKSPGRPAPKDARDVTPSQGVAAVLSLAEQAQGPATTPEETTPQQTTTEQAPEEAPTATERGTETLEILPPEPPRRRTVLPPSGRGRFIPSAPTVTAPFRGLAATGFEPLLVAWLGSLTLLLGLWVRSLTAGGAPAGETAPRAA